MRKPSVAPEGVSVKIHSEIAWGIASHWSWALASSTRTLAGQIDEALAAEREALKDTNAELLEAGTELLAAIDKLMPSDGPIKAKMRAAIAKAEGKP